MNIAICDDEKQYRQLLHERILQDSFARAYEVEIAEYETGAQLLEALENGRTVDVFFLDIQMEQGDDEGIQLAKELRKRGEKGLIVYVTGFIDYVQTGYEVKAFRYLLKSQIQEKLAQVLCDIREELTSEDYFVFQKNREVLRVNKEDILYIERDRRTLRVVCTQSEDVFYGNMDAVEETLKKDFFLRCHRSFLVNGKKIKNFCTDRIELLNGVYIPVSRSYSKEVKRQLMLNML